MKIAVFTGAGISRESGIATFRDSDGLWASYRIEDVCTPGALARNREGVIDFYNMRRREVLTKEPNAAHLALAELERHHDVEVITQNIDDLHERAGSRKVTHLHGENLHILREPASTGVPRLVEELIAAAPPLKPARPPVNQPKKSFAPLVGSDPEILILGSLPGEASLAAGEYYAHRANRFWPLIAELTGEPSPRTYEEKKRLLTRHRIALWDVAHSADREGSADAKIVNEMPNDLIGFMRQYPDIHTIALNGRTAEKMFRRCFEGRIVVPRLLTMLSTSPANCQYGPDQMRRDWERIFEGRS